MRQIKTRRKGAVKQLEQNGIKNKEEFYRRLSEELENGGMTDLAGVPCLLFSDQDDPSKLAYYVFSYSEPYFFRITTYPEVNDSLWKYFENLGIENRLVSEQRDRRNNMP